VAEAGNWKLENRGWQVEKRSWKLGAGKPSVQRGEGAGSKREQHKTGQSRNKIKN